MRTKLALVVLVGGTLAATAAGTAQERSPTPPTPVASANASVDALTSEVRLLRLAVEKSSQAQSQMQALMVYSAAQQSRLVMLASKSEAAQREVDASVDESEATTGRIVAMERALTANGNMPPNERQAVEDMVAVLKQDQTRLAARVATLKNRAFEADSAVQTELARWNDLMSRFEQAARPN